MKARNTIGVRCTCCGKYISYRELAVGPATQLYIPSTKFTKEENKVHCGKCTEDKGAPSSIQEVGLQLHYQIGGI